MKIPANKQRFSFKGLLTAIFLLSLLFNPLGGYLSLLLGLVVGWQFRDELQSLVNQLFFRQRLYFEMLYHNGPDSF